MLVAHFTIFDAAIAVGNTMCLSSIGVDYRKKRTEPRRHAALAQSFADDPLTPGTPIKAVLARILAA